MAQEAREGICAGLKAFVSKFRLYRQETETKGNETGNERKRSAVYSVKLETARIRDQKNEGGCKRGLEEPS